MTTVFYFLVFNMEYATRLMFDTTKTLPPVKEPPRAGIKPDLGGIRHTHPAPIYGGCHPYSHVNTLLRQPTTQYDFRSLYARGSVERVTCPDDALSMEHKLHRNSIWHRLRPTTTRVRNPMPTLKGMRMKVVSNTDWPLGSILPRKLTQV